MICTPTVVFNNTVSSRLHCFALLGQTALELAANKKMKQLLDVQPLQVSTCVHIHFVPCLSISRSFAKNVSWFSFSLGFLKETSQSCNQAWGPSTQGKIFLRNVGLKTIMKNIFAWVMTWQNKFTIISAKGTENPKESGGHLYCKKYTCNYCFSTLQ